MLTFLAAALLSIPPRDTRVNQGWEFQREAGWEQVDLPHSAKLQDETDPAAPSFQGIVWYKKGFKSLPAYRGKRVVLRVEAAMQTADIWVNGVARQRHNGGYLPFDIDLSSTLGVGQDAEVKLKVDNRDNPNFNPGRSQNSLDFTYAGGLYRDVWLEVTPQEHIEDVYATAVRADKAEADIRVEVTSAQVSPNSKLEVKLLDPSGKEVAAIATNAEEFTTKTFQIPKPDLWDLDHPHLYRAIATLKNPNHPGDELAVKFGVRHLEFNHKTGFSINGRPLKLEGSNRHMAFPVVGNAASDAAQYREAKLLKSLGLNILRLAHYPQSPTFLSACDELGLLVIDPIPGWQFFKNTPEFRNHVLSDVRETVLRDRNHPCVAIFETCLNETYNAPDDFWRECVRTAHETFGAGNFFTGGDSYGKQDYSRPIWDVPWTGWDDDSFTRPALFKTQMGIDREYGDYEFGGEQSSSRANRGDGEGAQLLQAWNFIWSHNRNRGNSWSFGDLTWEAIDTRRGMSKASPISKSGLLDFYRLPKPVADFYKSQGSPVPYVHLANEWTQRPSPTKVVVFGNCDEVALLLNGKEVARRKPDSGPTTGYIGPKVADPLYWAHGKGDIVPATSVEAPVGGSPGALPFSGGNCQNLAHPPFTFDGIPYGAGKLEAVGYLHGKPVKKDQILTPEKPDHLVLQVATQGRPLEADGADFVFVYASVVDRNGQVILSYNSVVQLKVEGAGTILGAESTPAIAGITPFMIRAKDLAGKISLEASTASLPSTRVVITSVKP